MSEHEDDMTAATMSNQQPDEAGQVWLIHDGVPPLPLNITSASIPDGPPAEVRRTIEIDIEDADL